MQRGIVGIDVGGTFTDLFYTKDGLHPARVLKIPSTPSDPSIGLMDALAAAELTAGDVGAIVHGTTIATNAVIERRGATCGLVTTLGFRDLLELGRRDRPTMYGLSGVQDPLIPRDRRWEVTERLDETGTVLVPLDEAELRKVGQAILMQGLDAVVIAFLHSYANPAHEERAKAILAEIDPDWEIVTSSGVIREYYEFERTSTAVVQGYLQPLIARYARALDSKLNEWGTSENVLIMQSNGGVTPLRQLAERSAYVVRSGPAAGVIAASRLAKAAGYDHVITGDMGGTSFDVAVALGGRPAIAETTNLDFRIPLRLPMIDVHTIGAGGGSIAHIDRGGMLQVGPQSAGADPGPVAFRRGGTQPTVTDANLVLGRINKESPIGGAGSGSLDLEGARQAVAKLGEQLGLGPEESAQAILAVVNQRMAGRIRLISIERGLDPDDFAMIAFGGAGPLHAAELARDIGLSRVMVPPSPGVLCAMGCALADVRYDLSQTLEARLNDLAPGAGKEIFARQVSEGTAQLDEARRLIDSVVVEHFADMAYEGQIHALRVMVEADWSPGQMAEAFERRYEEEFGSRLTGIPVVAVNLRTAISGVRLATPEEAPEPESRPVATPRSRRKVYFGEWTECDIYHRDNLLPGMRFEGPAIVEQADTTSLVIPGMTARVDRFGNLLLEL